MPLEVCPNTENGPFSDNENIKNNFIKPKVNDYVNTDDPFVTRRANTRNPVGILNNLFQNVEYKLVSQSGVPHAPSFTVSLHIDGKLYHGTAGSKKMAKFKAAEQALNAIGLFSRRNNAGLSPKSEYDEITETGFIKDVTDNKLFQNGSPEIDGRSDDSNSTDSSSSDSQDSQVDVKNKHFVYLLNNMYRRLDFKLVNHTVCDTQQRYTVSTEINGRAFRGTANTQKLAGVKAAEQALKFYIQAIHTIKKIVVSLDPSKPSSENDLNTIRSIGMSNNNEIDLAEVFGKNPVAVLNEMYPRLSYKLISERGPSHSPIFTMSVEVDGEIFFGIAASKKLSKSKAAEQALASIMKLINYNDSSSEGENDLGCPLIENCDIEANTISEEEKNRANEQLSSTINAELSSAPTQEEDSADDESKETTNNLPDGSDDDDTIKDATQEKDEIKSGE